MRFQQWSGVFLMGVLVACSGSPSSGGADDAGPNSGSSSSSSGGASTSIDDSSSTAAEGSSSTSVDDSSSTAAAGSSTSSSGGAGSSEGASSTSASTPSGSSSAGASSSSAAASSSSAADACTLAANTTPTSVMSPSGCAVLQRDTSACQGERTAQGLTGYWLKFSCRVTLTNLTGAGSMAVFAVSDGVPDHRSNYFPSGHACHETYTGAMQNPNLITTTTHELTFPLLPDMNARTMRGSAVVGMLVNGVPVFGNFAAPGDDIFREAQTFDRCGAHPQMTGIYHAHGEPWSISYDDSNFIGVMRDGYPRYGRRDPDGSMPTLDTYGGHTGVTVDSPTTAVYHYHVNLQTSTATGTSGQMQWFLTTGNYRGTPGP